MSKLLTAADIDWSLKDAPPPDGGARKELLSVALNEMHKQQITHRRDRERLIAIRKKKQSREEPSSTESNQSTPNLFQTARDIADATPETVEWVVKGYAAEHALTELTGLPKEAGKTSLLMGFVHAVLTGRACGGRAVAEF